MRGEYGILRSQLKGYLFEIVMLELLCKNGFSVVNSATEPKNRVRENRDGFIEFRGRGCWHQIDCPCDYDTLIPFTYPLRLLGEAKFYKSPLEKTHIRSFIGVIKDIQENYFIDEGIDVDHAYPRKNEIGVYFAANGFQAEAEKLAYAHCIKTISYSNNYIIDRIKDCITFLEGNYLSVESIKKGNSIVFKRAFTNFIKTGNFANFGSLRDFQYFKDGYEGVLYDLVDSLQKIRTSFIGSTKTGVFFHFVGYDMFPAELFRETDENYCMIYSYNSFFWLEFGQDAKRRRFCFTPPKSLGMAAVLGHEKVIDEKNKFFSTLNINIKINGMHRNLILHIDNKELKKYWDQIEENNKRE